MLTALAPTIGQQSARQLESPGMHTRTTLRKKQICENAPTLFLIIAENCCPGVKHRLPPDSE
jgi:hypothetical protein